MNNWKSILTGVGIPAELLSGNHCKCPLGCYPDGGGKDRFRFDNYQNNGGWFCNQCGAGNGMELIKRFNGIKEFKEALAVAEQNGYVNPSMFKQYNHEPSVEEDHGLKDAKNTLLKIMTQLRPAKGTPAELYLKKRRLSLVPQWTYRGGEVMTYYLPEDEYWNEGGEISKQQAIAWKVWRGDGQKYGLHRTYIDSQGNKAQLNTQKKLTRRMLPKKRMEEGGYLCVPLRKGDNNIVLLSEGIETALSAWSIMHHIHGENCTAMSLNNAAGIRHFIPQRHDMKYIIFADRDDKRTGQFAAVDCVKRLQQDFDINVVMPPDTHRDWNDIWVQNDKTELNSLPFNYWL